MSHEDRKDHPCAVHARVGQVAGGDWQDGKAQPRCTDCMSAFVDAIHAGLLGLAEIVDALVDRAAEDPT